MKRFRIGSVLFALPLAFLAACGGDDTTTTTTAGSPPAVIASSAPSSVPSASAAASAAAVASDRQLCASANAAKTALGGALAAGMDSNGAVSPAVAKSAMTQLSEALATVAASGGDSEVTAAIKQVGAEAAKAAAAPDPMKATEGAAFTRAGARLDAACKAA